MQVTAAAIAGASAPHVILHGKGFGTYYYDVQQPQTCGTDLSLQNQGRVMCNFNSALSLNDIITNNLVAMSNLSPHRIEVQPLRNLAHRRIVVRRFVEGKVSDLVLDTKQANDVKDLSCDVLTGVSFHQLRSAQDKLSELVVLIPGDSRHVV
ncbi:hypothetical protein BM221_008944 [Beauveria bassiana]|uniref:Uncharacterized protein n=1 Tax=Beauveria bassiana TaxID=176275 RepID=A0A2N6NEA2_BEABA|nr:hypothetical protein BM221_008944 [Beauveria bassiana]